jgi:hypothetical protein
MSRVVSAAALARCQRTFHALPHVTPPLSIAVRAQHPALTFQNVSLREYLVMRAYWLAQVLLVPA